MSCGPWLSFLHTAASGNAVGKRGLSLDPPGPCFSRCSSLPRDSAGQGKAGPTRLAFPSRFKRLPLTHPQAEPFCSSFT